MEQFRCRRAQVGLLCSAFLADGCLLPPVLALRHLRGCRFFSFFPAGGVSLRSSCFRVFVCFFCRRRENADARSLALRSQVARHPLRGCHAPCLLRAALRSLLARALRAPLASLAPSAARMALALLASRLLARFALRFAPHIRRGRRRRAGGRKRRTM